MSCQSRRDVVKLAIGAGFLACAGCGGGSDPGSSTAIPAGKVSDYAVGALQSFATWSLFVGRDAGGLYAMSSLCTHQGCDMAGVTTATGPYCGCHGSQFTATGTVVAGPARAALPHYAVNVDAMGVVTVDGTKLVAQSTRTTV